MDYEKVLKNTRIGLPGLDWTTISSGKHVAMMAGISKQLNYLGEDSEVVVFCRLQKMPLLRVGGEYFSVYGKIDDDFFKDYGMNSLKDDQFIVKNQIQLKNMASWMSLTAEEYNNAVVTVQKEFQKSIAKYVETENPMGFKPGSLEERLYLISKKKFDISEVMFHETKISNEKSIIENGFDLSKGEAANSDYQTPVGVFTKPDDISISLYRDDTCVQMPFFARKGSHIEIDHRDHLSAYLAKISPEWKKIADHRNTKSDEFDAKCGELMKKLTEVLSLGNEEEKESIKSNLDSTMKEWGELIDKSSPLAKDEIKKALEKFKVSSIRIKEDVGMWGKKADTTVFLNPEDLIHAEHGLKDFRLEIEMDSISSLDELSDLEQEMGMRY